MTKPDWTTAPAWATHLAMDADGSWRWFSEAPQYERGHWESSWLGGRVQVVCGTLPPSAHSMEVRP